VLIGIRDAPITEDVDGSVRNTLATQVPESGAERSGHVVGRVGLDGKIDETACETQVVGPEVLPESTATETWTDTLASGREVKARALHPNGKAPPLALPAKWRRPLSMR
jgi:hypothetical protein